MRRYLHSKVLVLMMMAIMGLSATTVFGDSAEFKVDTDLGDSFIGRFIVTYTGSTVLENPTFEFDMPQKITSVWDAVIESNNGNHYVVKMPKWVSSLPPGESFKFGFNAAPGYKNNKPTNLKFNGVAIPLTAD